MGCQGKLEMKYKKIIAKYLTSIIKTKGQDKYLSFYMIRHVRQK